MKQNLEDRIDCFENLGNWVKKNVGIYLTALAIGATGVGCASTTRIVKSGDVWYECFMDRNYPTEHPCYAEVQKYLAENRQRSSSSNSTSECTFSSGCGASEICILGRCVDNGARYSQEPRGHKVCKEKN